MKTLVLFIFCLCMAITLKAQTERDKFGKINKTPSYKVSQDPQPNLVIRFSGAEGQSVNGQMKLMINEELHLPLMDESGTYKASLNPGTYTLKLSALFVNDVISDTVIVIKNEPVNITIRYRTKACILPETRQGLCRVGRYLPVA